MKSRPKGLVLKGENDPFYAFLTQGIQVISQMIHIGPNILRSKPVDRPQKSRPKTRSVASKVGPMWCFFNPRYTSEMFWRKVAWPVLEAVFIKTDQNFSSKVLVGRQNTNVDVFLTQYIQPKFQLVLLPIWPLNSKQVDRPQKSRPKTRSVASEV